MFKEGRQKTTYSILYIDNKAYCIHIFAGLFLHVGYSVQDRYLLEGNSGMHFSPQEVGHKLGTLLNGDTAAQVTPKVIHSFMLSLLVLI